MKNTHGGKTALMILGTAALAGAGAFFLYGSKQAGKNRQKVKSWVLKAKAEALEQVEKAKQLDMAQYERVIDDVIARYKGVQGVTAGELKALHGELRGYWKDLSKAASGKKRKASAKGKK